MRIILLLLFFTHFLIISYARGYRFDFAKRSVKSTGIISVTSNPKAAKIFINSELKGVTDTNLTLTPDNYLVEVKKTATLVGVKINLKGELVINVDPVLFPLTRLFHL